MPKATHDLIDPEPDSAADLYERDEHAWIAAQIAALKNGELSRLDRLNLIEYLTDMVIRDRRELQSHLTVLQIHLLKVQSQPHKLTRSWVAMILEQQRKIRSIIENTPSLGRQADTFAARAYPDAVRQTAKETGLQAERCPVDLPWSVDAALAFDPPEPVPRG